MRKHIDRMLYQAVTELNTFRHTAEQTRIFDAFIKNVHDTLMWGQKVLICGNGGSHCDAMHFAEEMTGRYQKNRRPLAAIALGDASHTTCTANDYGFDEVFARQVEALGNADDTLIVLSTSGNSKNCIRAVETAAHKNIFTMALLGKDGGKLKDMVDLAIVIPSQDTARIQEVHMTLLHITVEMIERELFPENYVDTP